jgi:Holliday junction resolvase RusA-like endonuclease
MEREVEPIVAQVARVRFVIAGEPASKANSRQIVLIAGRPKVIKSEKARNYERDALLQIPASAKVMFAGPLRVTIRIWYASERPDLDESVVLDVLQDRWKAGDEKTPRVLLQAGVYRNDRQVREKHVYHGIDRANPRVEVKVELLQAMQANLDQGKVRNAIAFDEHSDGGCSVHPERLVHDEREALDRVCAWIESESAAAK